MRFETNCPKCKTKNFTPVTHRGKLFHCGSCWHRFIVPPLRAVSLYRCAKADTKVRLTVS